MGEHVQNNGQNFRAPIGSEYDQLVDPNTAEPVSSVEVAEVDKSQGARSEAERQMAIAAADRKNRQAAGLDARPHDLR